MFCSTYFYIYLIYSIFKLEACSILFYLFFFASIAYCGSSSQLNKHSCLTFVITTVENAMDWSHCDYFGQLLLRAILEYYYNQYNDKHFYVA